MGPYADLGQCDIDDDKKPFELWNQLALSFLDRLILGNSMDFQMCAKQFKCSDFAEADCPSEPTCRVFEGRCERITNFEHDEICESAYNFIESISTRTEEMSSFINKCCVKEDTAYINPYDEETTKRLINPRSSFVGQDGQPVAGRDGYTHCHDRMGNKGITNDNLLCDVSGSVAKFQIVRRNVMPLDLIMGVSPSAANVNRYDYANASRFGYTINFRNASNGFEFTNGIPVTLDECYLHLKTVHSEQIADDTPFVYGEGLVCSLLPCRDG